MAGAVLGGQEVIPWPVSLGVAGGAIAMLVGFLVWQNRQIASGKWRHYTWVETEISRVTVEADGRVKAAEAAADARIKAADLTAQQLVDAAVKAAGERVADAQIRGSEWKETALVEREGRQEQTEIARQAIESNRIVDHFFSSYLPPHPNVPQVEDNGQNAERKAIS